MYRCAAFSFFENLNWRKIFTRAIIILHGNAITVKLTQLFNRMKRKRNIEMQNSKVCTAYTHTHCTKCELWMECAAEAREICIISRSWSTFNLLLASGAWTRNNIVHFSITRARLDRIIIIRIIRIFSVRYEVQRRRETPINNRMKMKCIGVWNGEWHEWQWHSQLILVSRKINIALCLV